ncbi:hypothetical protein GLOTRDRAFT_119363 [Gloeophyllum trabeum ATCC 11539]|uniref:Uncharacterized protein n=1 Tax=Gloeophyllum trabeum (strain ATCC 11539 / FP-39264 / Madison 617) TaxID=670483 RepID=S7QIJ2_GLOTA|nr:uncharacterized protein GLOTRDRAFT_119363 [Gloeophyllum trabeum ATCC 11539]EPQ59088.1 hypothetical protein GLOTRDRAFT_119363 [Gloeophyllum trabeum ATCC 11539]
MTPPMHPRSSRHRRDPLADLPLDRFIAGVSISSPFKPPASPLKQSHKRPASPAPPSSALPNKRHRADLFSPPSGSPLKPAASPARSKYAASPSKAIDAMTALSAAADDPHATPKRAPAKSATLLAPSPELHAGPGAGAGAKRAAKGREEAHEDHMQEFFSSPARRPPTSAREAPPSPDRASVHYPGFDVYRDTPDDESTELDAPPPVFHILPDDVKENKAPPRVEEGKKGAIPGSPLKQGIAFSPSTAKKRGAADGGAKYRPMIIASSPRKETSAAPRLAGTLGAALGVPKAAATPGRSPKVANARRRMMEDELDAADGEDEF